MNKKARLALILALCTAAYSSVSANTLLYWDVNSGTTGAGGSGTPSGTWDGSTANWNTDPTGGSNGSLTGVTSGSDVFFAAGTDETTAYTVTVSGSQSAAGVAFLNEKAFSANINSTLNVQFNTPGVTMSSGTVGIGADGLVFNYGVKTTTINEVSTTAAQSWALNGGNNGLTVNTLVLNQNLTLTGGLMNQSTYGVLPGTDEASNSVGAATLGATAITGAGAIIVNLAPSGAVAIAPQTTYSGGVTLNSGMLDLSEGGSGYGSANAFGSGGVTFNGGSIAFNDSNSNLNRGTLMTDALSVAPAGGQVVLWGNNTPGATPSTRVTLGVLSGNITNSGAGGNLILDPTTIGTLLRISGSNSSFTGGFTISGDGGYVDFANLNSLGSSSNSISINAGGAIGFDFDLNANSGAGLTDLKNELAAGTVSSEGVLLVNSAVGTNQTSINLSSSGLNQNLRIGSIESSYLPAGSTSPSTANVTYSGTITPYAATYRFAASFTSTANTGFNPFTLSGTNQLNGSNNLDVSDYALAPGFVTTMTALSGQMAISANQDYTGTTSLYGIIGTAASGTNGSSTPAAFNNVASTTLTVSANLAGTGAGTMGAITVDKLGVLQFVGASGSASGASSLVVEGGGSVQDGDTTAANNTGVSNRINSAATLTLGGTDGGGTFTQAYGASGTASQTFASITVGSGSNRLNFVNTAAGTSNIISTASSFTRNQPGGVLFVPAYGTNGGVVLTSASSANASSGGTSINGYTFVGSTFAGVDSSGDIRAYTADTNSIGSPGAYKDTSTSVSLLSGDNTLTTAEIGASSGSAGINVQGNVLTLSLGGLAFNEGGTAVVQDTVGGGGITSSYGSTGSTNDELIVGGADSGTISAAIVKFNGNNIDLTTANTSILTLSNTGNQIGNVYVDAGGLVVSGSGALGQNGVTRTVNLLGGSIAFNTASYNFDSKTSWVVGPQGAIMAASSSVNSGGAGLGELKLSGSITLNGYLAIDTIDSINQGGNIELAGNITGPGAISIDARSVATNTELILSGNNSGWSGGITNGIAGLAGGGARAAVLFASGSSAGTGPINDSNSSNKTNFQLYLDTNNSSFNSLISSNYPNNIYINYFTPISTWSLGPGLSGTTGVVVNLSGYITGDDGLVLQGYATGANAVSETVLSGTVSVSGLPLNPWNDQNLEDYNFGTSGSPHSLVVGAGGIDLGVTNLVTDNITLTNSAIIGPSGSAVTNGALGFVRFSGSESLMPGATGAGFAAAIHVAGDTSAAGEFGFLLTSGTTNQSYQLPQGKGFLIGSLGTSSTSVAGVFGIAHDNDNPALTYTATFNGQPKAAAGQTLPGVYGGDIDIESTFASDTQSLDLLARAANDVLIIGGTSTVVFTPTIGDSGTSDLVTTLQKRTGLTTLNKVGAGVVNLKNVAFTNTDGSSAGTNFAFNVSAGTLLVSGSISGNTTVNSGGTFGGGGVTSGTTTVGTGGILYPGATGTNGTTLTLQNTVTFSGTSTFEANVNDSSGHTDLLAITGALNIGTGDTLTLNILNSLNPSTTYEIASYTSWNSTQFATVLGLPGGYQVDYTSVPDEIVIDSLTPVPEPGTWATTLSGLGFLVFAQQIRRRRRR